MAKIKQENITAKDIIEYLEEYSDFSFEIKVLNKFSNLGFKCIHSGNYIDPLTNKYREYDLRGSKKFQNMRINLAIECKNLSKSFPLVAHCTKRKKEECYHEIIKNEPMSKRSHISYTPEVIKYDLRNYLYKTDEYIAKSFDQVGRHISNNAIVNNDINTFEKISQAINSTYDLILSTKNEESERVLFSFILPILIIPDETLWVINYDELGNAIGKPKSAKSISYFINRSWSFGEKTQWKYSLSHLEIVTFSFIEKYIDNLLNADYEWENIFDV